MTPEERTEFESLMYEVGYRDGELVPSAEIGSRLVDALTDASQAGRLWAQWLLDDYLEEGAREAWKHWHNQEKKTKVFVAGKLVTKPAFRSVRLHTVDKPGGYWQPMMYEDMTATELRDLVRRSRAQVEAEQVNITTALKLLNAIEQTGAATVREAMASLGTHLDAYLGGESLAA